MSSKYCNYCNQMVNPTKHFSWVGFIFGFGIFYLGYYFLKSKKCPKCKGKSFSKKPPEQPE